MSKLTLAMTGISCLAAGALAVGVVTRDGPVPTVTGIGATLSAIDSSQPLAARVAALENALRIEQQARQVLQEELFVLTEQLDEFSARVEPSEATAGVADAAADSAAEPRSRRGRSSDPDSRLQRLVDAGFSIAEADEILRREAEIQMESLMARYEARRSGERRRLPDSDDILRDELGEARYERYLDASGRPTSVTVSTVYENSPALAAGVRPGDEILRYDGARVYSMNEISAMMLDGSAGEMITIDILRDGVPMQLSIPRGPLGVVGGRRYRR